MEGKPLNQSWRVPALSSYPSSEEFVLVWERSESVTHASVLLIRAGFKKMSPKRVLTFARVLRALGVELKHMSRPALTTFLPKATLQEKVARALPADLIVLQSDNDNSLLVIDIDNGSFAMVQIRQMGAA
jgi:hypothetical protein